LTHEDHGKFDMKLEISADPRHGGKKWTYYSREDNEFNLPSGIINPVSWRQFGLELPESVQ
jgi:hypothetical protein